MKEEHISPIRVVREFAKVLTNFVDKYASFSSRVFEKFFRVRMDKIGEKSKCVMYERG